MNRSIALLLSASLAIGISACASTSAVVARGPRSSVVLAEASNYQAAGHDCQVHKDKESRVVCDLGVPGRDFVMMGYNESTGQVVLNTMAPTQNLGKDCAALAPAMAATPVPPGLLVKCDFADDQKKIPAVVIVALTSVPDNGLSRVEFNQLVGNFLTAAKVYLALVVEQTKGGGKAPTTAAGSTSL
jgi:hypothetical protein